MVRFLGWMLIIEPKYTHQNFNKGVDHVILTDQWNQTTRGNGYLLPRYSCRCDVREPFKEGHL